MIESVGLIPTSTVGTTRVSTALAGTGLSAVLDGGNPRPQGARNCAREDFHSGCRPLPDECNGNRYRDRNEEGGDSALIALRHGMLFTQSALTQRQRCSSA